jgi:hypothetical protein
MTRGAPWRPAGRAQAGESALTMAENDDNSELVELLKVSRATGDLGGNLTLRPRVQKHGAK